jgi:hypothetical protein
MTDVNRQLREGAAYQVAAGCCVDCGIDVPSYNGRAARRCTDCDAVNAVRKWSDCGVQVSTEALPDRPAETIFEPYLLDGPTDVGNQQVEPPLPEISEQ